MKNLIEDFDTDKMIKEYLDDEEYEDEEEAEVNSETTFGALPFKNIPINEIVIGDKVCLNYVYSFLAQYNDNFGLDVNFKNWPFTTDNFSVDDVDSDLIEPIANYINEEFDTNIDVSDDEAFRESCDEEEAKKFIEILCTVLKLFYCDGLHEYFVNVFLEDGIHIDRTDSGFDITNDTPVDIWTEANSYYKYKKERDLKQIEIPDVDDIYYDYVSSNIDEQTVEDFAEFVLNKVVSWD